MSAARRAPGSSTRSGSKIWRRSPSPGSSAPSKTRYDSTVFDIDRRGWGHNASKHLTNPKKRNSEEGEDSILTRRKRSAAWWAAAKTTPATPAQAKKLVLLRAQWPPQKRGRIKPRTRPAAYWRKHINKAQALIIISSLERKRKAQKTSAGRKREISLLPLVWERRGPLIINEVKPAELLASFIEAKAKKASG